MGTIIINGQEVDLDALLEERRRQQPSSTQPATAQTLEPLKEEPSFVDLVVAHAKDNSLRFYLQKALDVFDPAEPNFTVTENDVAGYEDFPQLMMAKSRAELIQMKGIADDIKLQRRVMAESSPLANTGASLIAGLVDPINLATGFAGGGIVNSGFKIYGIGKRLVGWGGAAVKGAAGAAVAAPLDVAVRSSLDQREADVKEYVIGATASGLFGGLISAAPTIWRNVKGAERERAMEALTNLSNRYLTPEPIPSGNYKVASAFGFEKFSLGSPDLKLANSRFKTARDFGFNATPFSFNIVDKAGKPIAQNGTVEMSTLNAVSTDLYQFQKGVQKCFKQYLDESTQYNWCSKTFKNWSAFNFYRGKAYDEFSKEFMHAMLHPDEIPNKTVASMVELFRNASEELTQKAMKAGVFNENFEALKTTWETEHNELVKARDTHTAEVTKTEAELKKLQEQKQKLENLDTQTEGVVKTEISIREKQELLTENKKATEAVASKLEKLKHGGLTKEQTERLTYLDKRLADPKFTIADISNIKDPIYFPRIYRKDLLASKKGDARYRMERALAEGYRAEGSEKPIEELLQSASDSIDKIIGNKKSKHFNARKQRGSELQREIDIPTRYLEDFIVHDPMVLYENLARTFEPDIYLMKAFGTLNKEEILAKLKEERDVMARTVTSNKELRALDKDWSEAHDTISLVWDRLRGERSAEAEWGAKFLSGVKSYKVSSSLGQLGLTTLYNLSTIQQHVGLGIFLKNFIKIRTAKLIYGNKANADLWVRAFNATDYNRLTDLAEGLGYRGVDALARGLVKATFAQEIDEQCRLVLGYTILEKVVKACTKVANGKKLSRTSVRQLRRIGISKEMELRIADEFSKHGEILKGGIYKANFENWNEDVAEAFISAIRQVQYEGVLTPTTGTTPAIFDKAWGSTWLLFKRAMAAAYPKVTIPLLQDARKLKLIKVSSVFFTSAAASYLKELGFDFVTGRERTDDERIEKAISSMDMLSWGSYVYDLYKSLQKTEENPFFGGSRFLTDALGATSSFLVDTPVMIGGVYRGLTGEDIQRIQVQSTRRLLPFNNLIWYSWWINMWIDKHFPPKKKKQAYSNPFGF
jgi:hypothetical protein